MSYCTWTQISKFTYRPACGGKVSFFLGGVDGHVCTCGLKAKGNT